MSETADFIRNARTKCAMSIRNTAVGDWLGDTLRRLEESEAENKRLRETLDYIVDNPWIASEVRRVAAEALEGGESC